MTAHQYLENILQRQVINQESLRVIQATRNELETCLRQAFGYSPNIYYAGSYAKGTMIAEAFDLDILIYFPSDCGYTLKSIYQSVHQVLAKQYIVKPKDVALHLPYQQGFSVDVVPGRAMDATFRPVNLYRSEIDSTLKTSIKVHLETISQSGEREVMKLVKLWNVRHGLGVRSFALELVTIRALSGFTGRGLDQKFVAVLELLRDSFEAMQLIDPANSNNLISDAIPAITKRRVAAHARAPLAGNWEQVFG